MWYRWLSGQNILEDSQWVPARHATFLPAIAEKIIDGGGDFVLTLKGNQETLHDATIEYVNEQTKTDFRGICARRLDTMEKKHGRIERRTYIQMPAPKACRGSIIGRDCCRSVSHFSTVSVMEKKPLRYATSLAVCPSK